MRSNMTGQKFGKLTVMDKFRRIKGKTYWWCHCDCGNERWIIQCNFKKSNSCGCVSRKIARNRMLGKYGMATKKNVYCDYKKSARYRDLNFNIDFDKFVEMSQQKCYYCGVSPSTVEKSKYNNGDFVYNGIDRLDNNLGYEEGNCVSCCYLCNRMKWSMTEKDFLTQISKISKMSKIFI